MTKQVILYTTSTCPYCIRAKMLLADSNIEFTEINYRKISESELAELKAKTNNYRTVPQIFIGDTFVGGFDQLNQLKKQGTLNEMLGN